MKAFVVMSALLAVAMATPGGLLSYPGYGYHAAAPAVHYAAAAPAVHYAAAAPAVHYAAAPAVHYAAAPVHHHYTAAVAAPLHYPAKTVQYTAGPAQYAHVPAHYPAPLPDISSRYHAQTEVGQASHGYAHPGQAASEVRDASGAVTGEYSYVNPDGKEVKVTYSADSVNGFQAKSNLVDEVVQDTPEVIEARDAHLKAVAEATASAKAALDKALKDAAEKEAKAKKA